MAAAQRALHSLSIAPLGLGTSTFGWTADEAAAAEILDVYRSAGGNHIDTSPTYPQWVDGRVGGESESIIGAWLRSRGARDEMVLASKVGKSREARGLSRASIVSGVEHSLERLGTDRLDILYLHLRDVRTPLAESLAAADGLVRAGKVRAVGVANYSGEELAEAVGSAAAAGIVTPSIAQNGYSLLERDALEDDLRPVLEREAIGFVAHSSLAKGFLSGRYDRAVPSNPSGERFLDVSPHASEDGYSIVDAVRAVADQHGISPSQASIAWVLSRPSVAGALVSVRSADQLRELLPAADVVLDGYAMGILDAVSQPRSARERAL